MLQHHLPPAVEGNLDDPAAQTFDRGKLGLRCVIRRYDTAADAELSGNVGDSLSHVAGARGVHPILEFRRSRAQHGIAATANLERPYGLEIFQLEPQLG